MTSPSANALRVPQSLTRTAILLAALLVLGLSPLGFIEVPGIGRAITLLHIPMILAATLEGPLAAAILGAVFGLITGIKFPFPALPFHVLARVLAGLAAALTYQALRRTSRQGSRITLASAGAVAVGTLTNTLIMTLLVLLLGATDPEELILVAVLHGTVEFALALVVVVPTTIALEGRAV